MHRPTWPASPPGGRTNGLLYFLMLDEFSDFIDVNTESWFAFRVAYADALITAPILGRVDPLRLQQWIEQGSESRGMPEQWTMFTQELQDLPKRYAFVRKDQERPWWLPEWTQDFIKWPSSRLYRIKTPTLPDPVVNEQEYQELEEAYLNLYFRNIPDDGAPSNASTSSSPIASLPQIGRRSSQKGTSGSLKQVIRRLSKAA